MSALAFNPLSDGYAASPDPGPPPSDSNAGATQGATMGPNVTASAGVHHLQGVPPLLGTHNTPLHVAFLGLVALALVILLRKLGFRFSAVGKIGVGGR